ncbi:hypothetical protein FGB62_129g00 [Gracilaria domingensis]|nr:hypothetical protein FGB62_129g00 [Gracilaria domingensis]
MAVNSLNVFIIPPSMRKQTFENKKRLERQKGQSLARTEALRLLRDNEARPSIQEELQHLLSSDIRPGPSFTITNEEYQMKARESAVGRKRCIAATKKSAVLLGKAVVLSVRSGKGGGLLKAIGKPRTPIRSYQFAAFIVLEALGLAVELLDGEDVVSKLAGESLLAIGEYPANSFESSRELKSYWLDLKLKKKTLL